MDNNSNNSNNKNTSKNQSIKHFFRSMLYGEIVPITMVRRYFGMLIIVLLLAMGYIANKFMCQLDMESIRKLKVELARVKTDYVNASASYYSRIRETEMRELADSMGLGLKSPDCPPFYISSK